MSTRVLVVSAEAVGDRMAGPAIRALELARALADRCDVTIAAPAPSTVDDARIDLVEAGFVDYDALSGAILRSDVVVAQQLPTRLLARVAGTGVRLVLDLYNPTVMEALEYGRGAPARHRGRVQRLATRRALAHAAAADLILCASERQRDMWLGALAVCGLLDLADYDRDPTLRRVIDVVPFGLPDTPPAPGPPAIKGVWPGIAPGDRVLLWNGGVWNWLDPECAIDAVGLLADMEPSVHLCFLGMTRPGPGSGHADAAAARARDRAAAAGLAGHRVHFNDDWVPYAQRGRWLLDADLGVCTHRDHLEARFSFRTRLLDCLWAQLPVVCTRGDTLAELVAQRGLGAVVAPGDPRALADACRALLEDDKRRRAATAAIAQTIPGLSWSQAAAPLVSYCSDPTASPPRPHRRMLVTRSTLAQYPDMLRETAAAAGPIGVARRLARNLARVARPHG